MLLLPRKPTRTLNLGSVSVGGGHPISIQSMTNTPTRNESITLKQIQDLYQAGAQIVRIAVLDREDAEKISELTAQSPVPLVADIHFDPELALIALDSGIAGLRLNPGNIRERSQMARIAEQAGAKNIPIRIGVNAGSLDKTLYPHPTAEAMVNSALGHIEILESFGFENIKVSLKSSHLLTMIEAVRLFSKERDYPLHLGVTEAGTLTMSAVRSAMGIGTLLMEGLGDTIRVSVAGDPVKEIAVAREILVSLDLRKGIRIIACPTCGRTSVDVESLASSLNEKFGALELPMTLAVMGCVVNGPGEAKEADIALIGGKEDCLIYYQGQFREKTAAQAALFRLEFYIEQWMKENRKKNLLVS